MSADHLQFLENQFITNFKEAVEEFNEELPLCLHFEEILQVMNQKRITLSTPIRMKKPLYALKYALAECVMLVEKERERKTNDKRCVLDAHCAEKLWFLFWTRKKLLHIKRKLLQDMSDEAAAERPSSSRSVTVSQPLDWYFDASKIHGFNDHLQKIEAMILEARDTSSSRAIGIVGMGGSGKTALAQMLFHSPRVIQENFSPMLWVELPESLIHPEAIVLAILERLATDLPDQITKDDLDGLLHTMHEYLRDKKYLIVLDNVWHASDCYFGLDSNSNSMSQTEGNSSSYTRLSDGLPKGTGGTVIITSRIKEVATEMVMIGEQNYLHLLEPNLDKESCWSIVLDSVPEKYAHRRALLKMKDEIVDRCDGLPLAAKTLAEIIPNQLELLSRLPHRQAVLKLDLRNDRDRTKAMKIVCGCSGVESVALDRKDGKMTVTGDFDPVTVALILRKFRKGILNRIKSFFSRRWRALMKVPRH